MSLSTCVKCGDLQQTTTHSPVFSAPRLCLCGDLGDCGEITGIQASLYHHSNHPQCSYRNIPYKQGSNKPNFNSTSCDILVITLSAVQSIDEIYKFCGINISCCYAVTSIPHCETDTNVTGDQWNMPGVNTCPGAQWNMPGVNACPGEYNDCNTARCLMYPFVVFNYPLKHAILSIMFWFPSRFCFCCGRRLI